MNSRLDYELLNKDKIQEGTRKISNKKSPIDVEVSENEVIWTFYIILIGYIGIGVILAVHLLIDIFKSIVY